MKKIKYVLLLLPAAIFLNIYFSLPGDIHIAENSNYFLKLNPLCGANARTEAVVENSGAFFENNADGIEINAKGSGKYSLDVKILNFIPVKTVDVTISPERSVVPCGSPIGIKIFSEGLLVVNVSDVSGIGSPAKDAGIKSGDRIISANGVKLNFTEDFSKIIASSESLKLSVIRGEEEFETTVYPVLSKEGEKKIGIWVRDSTAGVGTMTFFDPKTSSFAALGHSITDADTGDAVILKNGNITDCEIICAQKGRYGEAGILSGIFGNADLGEITLNSGLGIYGKIKSYENLHNEGYMAVASRFQVKKGEAYILCDVDGEGVRRYSVFIEEVSKSGEISNKSIILHVTDELLLEKTGGIVRGMSGSPIIQNGKLIGAVTHVFVNDPTRGYAVFAENMLDEAGKG